MFSEIIFSKLFRLAEVMRLDEGVIKIPYRFVSGNEVLEDLVLIQVMEGPKKRGWLYDDYQWVIIDMVGSYVVMERSTLQGIVEDANKSREFSDTPEYRKLIKHVNGEVYAPIAYDILVNNAIAAPAKQAVLEK